MGLVGSLNILLTVLLSAFVDLFWLAGLTIAWAAYGLSIHWQNRELHLPKVYGHRLLTLRWFFLALLVLHGLGAVWGPRGEELAALLAFVRQVLVLVLLMLAVTVVLEALNVAQRVRVFSLLLRPLSPLGLNPKRVGAMLAVALSEAFELRKNLKTTVIQTEGAAGLRHVDRVVQTVANQCLQIERVPRRMAEQLVTPVLSEVPMYFLLAVLPLFFLLCWQGMSHLG